MRPSFTCLAIVADRVDRFRWAYCQLDNLRRCMSSSIRKALDELPTTLDETYERTLEGIPKQKWQHAHRLFQCMVAAMRPLSVEELGEIFAIEFGPNAAFTLMEGWRPENAEDAVLSACSTLITIVDDQGSKIVQFSHFSVKEFLTSYRLETSVVRNICRFHIPLEPAHTTLARACLTVLLQMDENIDKKRLATFPMALYAALHWVDHAQFGNVASEIEDGMQNLFNPKKPHFLAWVWIVGIGRDSKGLEFISSEHPLPRSTTPLHYVVFYGFSRLAKHLITTHGEDVNAYTAVFGSPLQAASAGGHVGVARVLLDHGADGNGTDPGGSPLCSAYRGRYLKVMQLLLEHGADVEDRRGFTFGTALHDASFHGQLEIVDLLLQYKADVNARSKFNQDLVQSLLDLGHHEVARFLLKHGVDIYGQYDFADRPLLTAADDGFVEFMRLLRKHGEDMHIREFDDQTPFQIATENGHHEIAQLLLEHGSERESFFIQGY